jgi:hypothetical protein
LLFRIEFFYIICPNNQAENSLKTIYYLEFPIVGMTKWSGARLLAPMEVASFLVLNLFQDPETSSGLERYNVQREIAPPPDFAQGDNPLAIEMIDTKQREPEINSD